MPESLDAQALLEAGRWTVTVPEAGAILGIGRSRSFELARTGDLPGVRRLGRRYIVSLAELAQWLGVPFEGVNANGNGAHSTGLTEVGNDESAPRG